MMFENLFSASPQFWTGLIATAIALPILIHLINLMRHKKVEWAAMEFLLRSHRKNRSWVWLKQLLLLLIRIVMLALALFMMAQVGCENDRVARLLGGRSTHHYVLLDDSFSMGQRDSGGRTFDRAVGMVSSIASRAKNRQNQVFSLYRYSADQSQAAAAVLDSLTVDTNFDQTIESTKGQLNLSASAADAEASLERVAALVANRKDENAIVYFVSDFCERNWKQPEQIKNKIVELERLGAAVELIDCSNAANDNLAVTGLAPIGHVRAAQTPLMMEVKIHNYSNSPATKVQIELQSAEYPKVDRTSRPEDVSPDWKQLPTVFIDSISPGQSAVQAFPVFFNRPGQQVVVAQLENDALAVDNRRLCNVKINESSKVLLVEAGAQTASRFFSIVLNPGGSTGISSQLADESFLRDRSTAELDEFDTIFLFDVGSLGDQETTNLESYVRRGGGVIFFAGPNTNTASYTEKLYRDGQGVLPLPLERPAQIEEVAFEQGDDKNVSQVADLQPTDHPVFAPANSVKNSLLDLVQIKKVLAPPIEWNSTTDPSVEILATVRGSAKRPLVISKRFGKGRSVLVTTTADSTWNNWMRNATFLPIMLLMQDYAAAGRYSNRDQLVGEPVEYTLDSKSFRRDATLVFSNGDERNAIPIGLEPRDADSQLAANVATTKPGVYELWGQAVAGFIEVIRPTVNVDTRESDIEPAQHDDLMSRLGGTAVNLVDWDQFNPEPKIKPASLLNRLLFCLLVAALVVELFLGYSTNYHR